MHCFLKKKKKKSPVGNSWTFLSKSGRKKNRPTFEMPTFFSQNLDVIYVDVHLLRALYLHVYVMEFKRH